MSTDREMLLLLYAQIGGHLAIPAPVDPPKPIDPPPPPKPAGPNPFIEWRKNGGDLVSYMMWRNNGLPLSDLQLEQAYEAGYPRPGPPIIPGGPVVDPTGFVLSAEKPLVRNHVNLRQTYTFVFPDGFRLVEVFPVGGDEITHVNGEYSPGGKTFPAVGGVLSVSVDGNTRTGQMWLGVKLHP